MYQASSPLSGWIKWAIAIACAVLLAWRVLVTGIADYVAFEGKDYVSALNWNPAQPRANLELALTELQTKPEAALGHLKKAVSDNPAEGRGYAGLGQLLDRAGNDRLARQAMDTAARMGPNRSDIQMEATVFWARKGDFPKALKHWDVVLRHQPDMRGSSFPYLLNGADDPANEPAFRALLGKPLPWWNEFFTYAAEKASNLETVRRLYRLTKGSAANPLQMESFRIYLARLQKEQSWTEAWFDWLGTLSREDLAQSGNIFNGSFEQRPSDTGFDWIYNKSPAAVMEVASTFGSTGERALHLIFKGVRIKFGNLYQYLLLPQGDYFLKGRVRPDNLKTAKGMQWALYCLGQNDPLAVTEQFNGMGQWTRFRNQFAVPEGCPVQVLRLELAGRIDMDYDVNGSIWFDDLSIEQKSSAIQESDASRF